jgi:PAS domain-containing protein
MKSSPRKPVQLNRKAPTAIDAKTQPGLFPIVGIGASAGGLEAFSELLRYLPEKTGMGFVLVQHLDPKHESGLQEILSRTTKIPVTEVTLGMVVQPDQAYVIPANTYLTIKNGVLQLGTRVLTRGQHMPIDGFFRSLAENSGQQAIGVILSRSGLDGTEGCRAIKAAGGITLAQNEESAKYDSMPRSAVNAGCIDFILPPKDIARELGGISQNNRIEGAVISLQDVDALKRSLDQTREYADTIVESARQPILVLDAKLHITAANPAFYRVFEVAAAETEGRLIYELGNGQWNIERLRELLEEIIPQNSRVDDFEMTHEFPHIGSREMHSSTRAGSSCSPGIRLFCWQSRM